MTPKELQDRTKQFAVQSIKLCRELPTTLDARCVGSQLIEASTSVAANYRAVCRARSRAEFAAKLGTVLEEAAESLFWLELMVDAGIVSADRVRWLKSEANELTSIVVASRKTTTARR